jgi:hypothetical protein
VARGGKGVVCAESGTPAIGRYHVSRIGPPPRVHSPREICGLALLSYLPAEPCPDYLADLTIHRLCRLAAQRASARGSRSGVIRLDPRQWFRNAATVAAVAASIVVFASTLILSFDPVRHSRPSQVPAEQWEKTLTGMHLDDSAYTWLPVLDEPQAVESVPKVPRLFPVTSGPAGYYPHQIDHSIELGPRIVPASWERHVEQSSQ